MWNYYNLRNDSRITSVTDISDDIKCKLFIKEFIAESGKGKTFLSDNINTMQGGRISHIVSTFFLGFVLYNQCRSIKDNVNRQLHWLKKNPTTSYGEESNGNKFAYIWFLTCLFHDLGYVIESNQFSDCGWMQQQKKLPRRPKWIPAIYTKDLLEKYDLFRRHYYDCFDHGIYGAEIFYNDLLKIREEKENSNDTTRFWGKELIQYFNLAAWIIACHNVFYVKEDDSKVRCYQSYGLDSLIYQERARKISLKKHPLFFLLCLVDSIDMAKVIDLSVDDWGKIQVTITDTQIRFIFSDRLHIDYQKFVKLDEWLTSATVHHNELIISLR